MLSATPKNSIFAGLLLCALATISVAAQENFAPATEPAQESAGEIDEEKRIENAINSLPDILEIRTNFFTIYGDNRQGARRISEIARKLERHITRFLGWGTNETGEKMTIWAELPPEGKEDMPAIVEIWKDFRGNKMCSFGGDLSQLSDFDIAYALAETVVRQYAQDHNLDFGGDNKGNPPLWLPAAIAAETDISGESGRALAFFSKAKKSTPLKFSELAEPRAAGKSPDENFRVNALMFYRFLRRQRLASWQRLSDLVEVILVSPESAFPESEITTDLLWATSFYATLERSPLVPESPIESQKRFENSLQFLVEIDGVERRISADELAEFHELLGVKKIAYVRVREIAEGLPGTNPVWHNAFAELGVFLEMLAFRERGSARFPKGGRYAAEKKAKLLEELKKVRAEQQTALELQGEIYDLLKARSHATNPTTNPPPQ